MVELSVLVPVKNERENILPLLQEIHAALEERCEFEVIYINDGSTDRSPNNLSQVLKTYPRLRVLTHAQSCGQSAALMSGVRVAKGEWIATLDGDGQNDPADIPKLLQVARDPGHHQNLQLIAGWHKQRKDTWLKQLSSRIANGVRSRMLAAATSSRSHPGESGVSQ